MSDQITIFELKEKLRIVNEDIARMQQEPGSDKKLEVMAQYQDYIKDEIRMLEQEERDRKEAARIRVKSRN